MIKKKIIKESFNIENVSWSKIFVAIFGGILFGYLVLASNLKNLSYSTITDLIVLALLACVLALLLDIRKITLAKK